MPRRKDPYLNFRFRVEIGGIQIGFSEVIIKEMSADVIEYREGATFTVRKLPARINYGNIIFKKGLTDSDEVYRWWKDVEQGNFRRKDMSIVVIDEEGRDAVRWNIVRAFPVRYKLSALSALGNQVEIESMEIVHEGMRRA